MKPLRVWQGVRLRRLMAGADADASERAVTLPASWDDTAAAALAMLAPGTGAANLAVVADGWIRPIAERARRNAIDLTGETLHALLRRRQAAPTDTLWRNEPEDPPGYILNLAAFHDAAVGFDTQAFTAAIDAAVTALTLAAPGAPRIHIAMADLAGLLASLGLDYDGTAARDLAACLAALLRATADTASARLAGLFGIAAATPDAAPVPPAVCIVPGLAAAAAIAWANRPLTGLRHTATTAILPPGAADALLGIETGGVAPAFSALACGGGLTRTARSYLAARGLTAEAALADLMIGIDHLKPPAAAAERAMHDAVAPYLHVLPAASRSVAPSTPACTTPPGRQELPARRRGYAQRAAIGGHTLFLRTGEYADGRLGEICITPQKESAAFRGLMDSFAQSVSIGLQHNVPLADYVEAFTLTRFGPAGTVEGDPAIPQATSLLDYVFRHLAINYLPGHRLPAAHPVPDTQPPLLPLDLPQDNAPRRRARLASLRVVNS